MSTTQTNISWLRGPIDFTNLQTGQNKIHIIARRAVGSNYAYYNLYPYPSMTPSTSPSTVPSIVFASKEYAKGPIAPVSLVINSKTGGYSLIYSLNDVVFYLNYDSSNSLTQTPSTGGAFLFTSTLNISGINLGVWYKINTSSNNPVYFPFRDSGNNLYNFTDTVGSALSLNDFDIIMLPYNGSFISNAKYLSGGISTAGCYSNPPYDVIISFQDTIYGRVTEDNPPSNRQPITGCTGGSTGWMDGTYNYCVFSTAEECTRNYWYDYCSNQDTCGTCRGICPSSTTSKCLIEYASTSANKQIPLSCDRKKSKPTVPNLFNTLTTTQKIILLVVALVALSMLIGVPVYLFVTRKRK